MLELNVHSVQLGGYPGRDTTVRVIYDSKFVEYSLAKNQSAKLSLPTGSYIEVAGAHPADRKPWTQTLTAENLARVQSGCFAGGVFFFEVCEKRGSFLYLKAHKHQGPSAQIAPPPHAPIDGCCVVHHWSMGHTYGRDLTLFHAEPGKERQEVSFIAGCRVLGASPGTQVTVRSAWTMSAKDHPDVPNRNREAIKTFSAEEAKNRHIHVTCWRKTNDYESTIEQAVFPFEEALQWNTADDLAAAFPEPKMEPVDPFHLVLHNVSMEDFRMKVTVRSSGRKAQFEMEGRGNRVLTLPDNASLEVETESEDDALKASLSLQADQLKVAKGSNLYLISEVESESVTCCGIGRKKRHPTSQPQLKHLLGPPSKGQASESSTMWHFTPNEGTMISSVSAKRCGFLLAPGESIAADTALAPKLVLTGQGKQRTIPVEEKKCRNRHVYVLYNEARKALLHYGPPAVEQVPHWDAIENLREEEGAPVSHP
ncbi:unnamed protein product [Symbiodinium natans]|uniref:Uncharacterized protein n=1 Tax=Symbiodinium natans TaxID=878477 RepID=A0A812PV68_9DINO|nr:unnamed protein product [Symbiodinium natans]